MTGPDGTALPGRYTQAYIHDWMRAALEVLPTLNAGDTAHAATDYIASLLFRELERRSMAATGRRYRFVLLAGSHNTGKTTIRDYLKCEGRLADFAHYTTRRPRRSDKADQGLIFIDEEDLLNKDKRGELLILSKQDQGFDGGHYYTAIDKTRFYDLVNNRTPFIMERRLSTWRKLLDTVPKHIRDTLLRETLIVFLLPTSMESYAARIAERASTNANGTAQREKMVLFEIDRSLTKHHLLAEARHHESVLYICNDDVQRVGAMVLARVEYGDKGADILERQIEPNETISDEEVLVCQTQE